MRLNAVHFRHPGPGALHNGCADTYDYRSDGTFSSSSAEERMVGRYAAELSSGTKASLKVLRAVASDNRQADCTGSTKDQSGSQDTRYLVFGTNKNQMQVCFTATGERCFGPLVRQ